MNVKAPTMTRFAVAVLELGLTLEEQERARARAALQTTGLDDPDIHRICEDIKMERNLKVGITKIEELTSKLSADIDERMTAHVETMKDLSASVGKAMSKGAAEVMPRVGAAVADALKAKLEDLPSMVGSSMDKAIVARTEEISRKAVDDHQRLTFTKERNTAGIALAVGAVILLAAVGWSWTMAKDIAHSENATAQAFFSRSDAKENVVVMANNNMTKVFASYCLPEQRFVVNGRTMCKADLALDGPLQSTTGLDGLVALYRETVVKLGTWGLVGLGVIGTLLTQWTRRRLKKNSGAVA
ncbi:hypothetical protein G6L68_25380 [Agrobacterium fabrum]|uniref:hypothetical protein n=1 Tax=Agrobacterium fabrum TaxID=1176649 RepID=UPI000F0BEFEE|nr:hypothetical protein [Agrobacterium fabrum]AYM66120.1 hypothetical protein At12D13_49680 [Agrobacterium fabrum]NTE63967.1 hypothetical protein [Agrobacterium fabrum]